jgi:hypothetical protein
MKRTALNTEELQNRERTLSSIRDATERKLQKLGFNAVPRPEKTLEIPFDITKIDGKNLGRLFHRSIAWENYAGDQLAYSKVAAMLADYQYELVLAKKMMTVDGGVQHKKAQALASPLVRKAKLTVLRCTAQVMAFESQFSRYTRISMALSREQTRREKLNMGD